MRPTHLFGKRCCCLYPVTAATKRSAPSLDSVLPPFPDTLTPSWLASSKPAGARTQEGMAFQVRGKAGDSPTIGYARLRLPRCPPSRSITEGR